MTHTKISPMNIDIHIRTILNDNPFISSDELRMKLKSISGISVDATYIKTKIQNYRRKHVNNACNVCD